jgi:hypothetical protein
MGWILPILPHFTRAWPKIRVLGFLSGGVLCHSAYMGNKDKGKKEAKKAPKPKPKPEASPKREIFTPPPAK